MGVIGRIQIYWQFIVVVSAVFRIDEGSSYTYKAQHELCSAVSRRDYPS